MTVYQFAGVWADSVSDAAGKPLRNKAVTAIKIDGTTTDAALFTDRTKATGAVPGATDGLGNYRFYADPGHYRIFVVGGPAGGVFAAVAVDPAEAVGGGGGGGGAVDSVNGQTGVVVLAATDVGADASGAAAAVNTSLGNHLADATDAHDASAVSFVPAGPITATDVQAAVVQAAFDAAAFLAAAHTWEEPQTFHTTTAEQPEPWLQFFVDSEVNPRISLEPWNDGFGDPAGRLVAANGSFMGWDGFGDWFVAGPGTYSEFRVTTNTVPFGPFGADDWIDLTASQHFSALHIQTEARSLDLVVTDTASWLELLEGTAVPAGGVDGARLFTVDNGSGKTRLMAQFRTGAAVQVAIEP